MHHLGVISQFLALDMPPLPFIAIPMILGTGADVKNNAFIDISDQSRTGSLRNRRMFANLASI